MKRDIGTLTQPRAQKLYFSYDKIEQWLRGLSNQLRDVSPSAVIGILRGGYFPASVVSHITGAPLSFLRFNRANGTIDAKDLQLPPPGSKVLLCEDIAGSGVTLLRCRDYLLAQGLQVIVLTVISDSKSRIIPDFSIAIGQARGILPWERHVDTHAYIEESLTLDNGVGLRGHDHEYDLWGFDLDGVFLRDVPEAIYNTDLHAAIQLRSTLAPDHTPLQLANPHAIITAAGRGSSDYGRVAADARDPLYALGHAGSTSIFGQRNRAIQGSDRSRNGLDSLRRERPITVH